MADCSNALEHLPVHDGRATITRDLVRSRQQINDIVCSVSRVTLDLCVRFVGELAKEEAAKKREGAKKDN